MKNMTLEELQTTKGGALSGAFLLGVGAIVDAVTNFVTSVGGLGFIFSGSGQSHTKGSFQFNKNMHFSWDDTKIKGDSLSMIETDNSNYSDYDYQSAEENCNFSVQDLN